MRETRCKAVPSPFRMLEGVTLPHRDTLTCTAHTGVQRGSRVCATLIPKHVCMQRAVWKFHVCATCALRAHAHSVQYGSLVHHPERMCMQPCSVEVSCVCYADPEHVCTQTSVWGVCVCTFVYVCLVNEHTHHVSVYASVC